MNIGPPIKDTVTCQLSDSDDIQHPGDLKPLEGFMYRRTEVRNSHYMNEIFVLGLKLRNLSNQDGDGDGDGDAEDNFD